MQLLEQTSKYQPSKLRRTPACDLVFVCDGGSCHGGGGAAGGGGGCNCR